MMARVRVVIAFSSFSGSISASWGRTSTSTGRAPQSETANAVEAKVIRSEERRVGKRERRVVRHTRWTGDWSSDVCSSDLGTNCANRIHVGALPVKVNGNDGPRSSRDRFFQFLRINQRILGTHVDEHGSSAAKRNCKRRGGKGH